MIASYTPAPFEVIANGEVFQHQDFVSASVCCHERKGKLYRVIQDPSKPRNFYRQQIEPIHENVAQRCLERGPRKPKRFLRCVPVFGR